MKACSISLILCLFNLITFSQDNLTNQLKEDYETEKYDLIISNHYDKVTDYPARAVYYVGMAFYMKENDQKTIEMMNLSIQKDATDPDAHFIQGKSYSYSGQLAKAKNAFFKAIKLDTTNSSFYSGLGDVYFNNKEFEEALKVYISATKAIKHIDRPFVMIPQIYAQLGQPENSLVAFYKAKEVISTKTTSYITVLYNIGLYELLNKEYPKAELAFQELLKLSPNDFHSYAKLIQVYYGQKDYEKAKPLRDKLYQAYDAGLLKGQMKDMFCFDQFNCNGQLVQVFERFAVKEGELYYKHIFYIVNKEGKIQYSIQTENSPVSVELGGPKYFLGMDFAEGHKTFGHRFDEDFDYDELKRIVTSIIEAR